MICWFSMILQYRQLLIADTGSANLMLMADTLSANLILMADIFKVSVINNGPQETLIVDT